MINCQQLSSTNPDFGRYVVPKNVQKRSARPTRSIRKADLLCVGIDDASMATRRLILEKAGHTVTQLHDLRQVQAACETKSFSVVVLGQSLNANEKKRISDILLKYCKNAKILELHSGIGPELPSADSHLQVNAGQPEALSEAVNALLRRS